MKLFKKNASSGFSLIELLIGGAIATITMMACMYFINQSFKSYAAVSSTSDNIIETLNGSALLKNKLSTAVNIEYFGAGNLPLVASNLKGYIRPFDISVWAPAVGSGQTIKLMSGYIDQLKSNATGIPAALVPSNRFLPFSLFFQRPTIDKYGVIYLSIGAPGSLSVSAAQATFQLDQIVDFSLRDIKFVNSTLRVSQFTIELIRRSYKSVSDNRFIWCPPAFMGAAVCANHAPYFETTEFINVNLRNNVLQKSSSQKQNIAGSIPPRYEGVPERLQTGLYYLSPVISWETLKR